MIAYGEALANIGFSTREVMRLSAQGLRAEIPTSAFILCRRTTVLGWLQAGMDMF